MARTKNQLIIESEGEEQLESFELTTLVYRSDKALFTTSLVVAQAFGKEHKAVLKAINNLGCSSEFYERNFAPVEYTDAKGENRPAYTLTRDAFSFLVMGFTGRKAAVWKEKFIEAFNAMEAELVKSLSQKDQDSIRDFTPDFCVRIKKGFVPISAEQRRGLQGLVDFWAEIEGISDEEARQRALSSMDIPSWDYVQPQEVNQFAWNIQRMMFRASKEVSEEETNAADLEILNGLLDYGTFVRGFKRKALVGCLCAMCGIPDLEHLSAKGVSKAKMALWVTLADIKMG